ncbi:hypothetical protein QM040_10785 [Escherichia coli]|uniref:hypothetical protein n=1 Tax=Escherichia coli TaxID=562 RepID=UPI0024DF793D|nr:hypothetical protein [Escherichia coli]WIC11196.1 hypothetical protein QM040_10785 [Escherichia coli]
MNRRFTRLGVWVMQPAPRLFHTAASWPPLALHGADSMTINKQAYHSDGGDIGPGRLKEIADNVYGDEEKCWLAKRVLALLDELEAAERRISALESERDKQGRHACELFDEVTAQRQRIAELEARAVTLPRPACTYADHSYPAYSERQVLSLLEALGIRINGEE